MDLSPLEIEASRVKKGKVGTCGEDHGGWGESGVRGGGRKASQNWDKKAPGRPHPPPSATLKRKMAVVPLSEEKKLGRRKV